MKSAAILLACRAALVSAASVTFCDYFNATTCTGEDTNYALKNYGICQFEACGGDEVVISSRSVRGNGASCGGDTYMRLIDEDGDLLGFSDDATFTDKCSEIVFSLPEKHVCRSYESRIGCFGAQTNCEAQVVVNVSDTRPSFTSDTMTNNSAYSWVMNCSEFNLTETTEDAATIFDFDPATTTVCSFEACAGQYYSIGLDDCTNGSVAEIFTYGGADLADDLLGSVSCGSSVVLDGFGSSEQSGVGKCHLVSLYQTCSGDMQGRAYCSGQTTVTAKRYPGIDVQWLDELLVSPGQPLRYTVSNFTANDETADEYLAADTSDLYIAVYKEDMLANQQYCNYVSFDGSVDVNFFDYIDFESWDGIEKTEYVSTMPIGDAGSRYVVSEFGGIYKVIIWLWRKNSIGMDSPIMVASSSRLRISHTASIAIAISEASPGGHVIGSFDIINSRTVQGDQLVIYAVDDPDTCHFKHDVLDFDNAIWSYEITASNLNSGTFTTADADGSSEAFVLPVDSGDAACTRVQEFELRYIRDGEVIGRSTVLPIGSPTAAPTSVAKSTHSGDGHTLEYAVLITVIVVGTVAAIVYVVYFQKISPSDDDLARGSQRRGGGDKKGGFSALSSQNDPKTRSFEEVDVDNVDPSFFQIEMLDDGDDEQEIVF